MRLLAFRYSIVSFTSFRSAGYSTQFLPESQIDLVDYAGLMLDLSRLLGRKVDLVSKNGLKPLIRDSVLAETRLVYAA